MYRFLWLLPAAPGRKDHFYDALTKGKADAVLAASLFHYKELEIMDLKNDLAARGVSVRR